MAMGDRLLRNGPAAPRPAQVSEDRRQKRGRDHRDGHGVDRFRKPIPRLAYLLGNPHSGNFLGNPCPRHRQAPFRVGDKRSTRSSRPVLVSFPRSGNRPASRMPTAPQPTKERERLQQLGGTGEPDGDGARPNETCGVPWSVASHRRNVLGNAASRISRSSMGLGPGPFPKERSKTTPYS